MFTSKRLVICIFIVLLFCSIISLPSTITSNNLYSWNILAENSRNVYGNTNIFTEIIRTRYTFQEMENRNNPETFKQFILYYNILEREQKQNLIDYLIYNILKEDFK